MHRNVLRWVTVLCFAVATGQVSVGETEKVELNRGSVPAVNAASVDKELQPKVQGNPTSQIDERPNVKFKTGTYVLLGLSATIGPIVIFLLFRNGRQKRNRNRGQSN